MEPRKHPFDTTSKPSFQNATPASENPPWWTDEHASTWDRIKEAFRRDWEQTKANFGSEEGMDLHQNAADTLKQATGSEPVPAPGENTRLATRDEANKAQQKMFDTASKAAQQVARAQDKISNEQAKLEERTRDAQEKLAKQRGKAAERIAKAAAVATEHMADAEDEIDDAVMRRQVVEEEWARAEQEARYGFAARAQFPQFPEWNEDVELALRGGWADMDTGRTWDEAREGVRRGWDYSPHSHH